MARRILLVDDDVSVLHTLQAVLELHHLEVEAATSAAQACEKLRSSQYDLVITDAHMQSEDSGLQVIRVAQQQTYRPVLALLTALPAVDARWAAEGVQALLVKPLATHELVQRIEALLAGSSSSSAA